MDRKKDEIDSELFSKNGIEKIAALPILFIVTILPLIVRYKEYLVGLSQFTWFPTSDVVSDFFLYYKQWALVVVLGIMIVVSIIFGKKFIKNNKVTKEFIFLYAYGIITLLSGVLAYNRNFAFLGGYGQYESVIVLLGYIFIILYIFYFFNCEETYKKVFKYLTFSIIYLTILGISQYFGKDIMLSRVGYNLIFPNEYREYGSVVKSQFGSQIALTLYNPNYVGVYASMLLGIYITFLITIKEKKEKVISAIVVIALAFCLIASKSKAGMITASLVAIIAIIMSNGAYLKKVINKKIIYGIVSVVVVVFIAVGMKKINYYKTNYNLKGIEMTDNVILKYKGNEIYLNYIISEDNKLRFEFKDEQLNDLNVYYDQESMQFTMQDEKYDGIIVKPNQYDDTFVMEVTVDETIWAFHKGDDDTYYYINAYGKQVKIEEANSSVFTEYASIVSGRGYIWSRVIPMLKNTIFYGVGANNFIFAFPHNDYVGYVNNGFGGTILTKPHSLYLQMAVENGILAAICFVIFYIIYFIKSVKLYKNNRYESYQDKVGLACFIASIGYMVSGLTNDSSITVAPVFWVIIGLGIKLNVMITKNNQEK